ACGAESGWPPRAASSDAVGKAKPGFSSNPGQRPQCSDRGKSWPLLDCDEQADRARRQRQSDKPTADRLAPAPPGKTGCQDQNRGDDKFEEDRVHFSRTICVLCGMLSRNIRCSIATDWAKVVAKGGRGRPPQAAL